MGVIVGSGAGGIDVAERQYAEFFAGAYHRVSPYAIPVSIVGIGVGVMALIAASVPEETSRTISTDGPASTISAASSTSASVGAPNVVPRSTASWTAASVSGSA